ncbi:zinc finger domain-containing protein [Streptomyces sp. NPDC003314]
MTTTYETDAETNTTDLMAGPRITLDELAVELSAIELRLRQLARAAEVPATPVELADTIESLRYQATSVRELGERAAFLARVVVGDVPLAKVFSGTSDPWGVAARTSDREDFGGPAIVPTQRQLLRLAEDAARAAQRGEETTTYPEAMEGLGIGWESKAASARRRRERNAAVEIEIREIPCESCKAGAGEECRTKNGRISEQPHVPRRREAEATVDARLGYLGDMPVDIPSAR